MNHPDYRAIHKPFDQRLKNGEWQDHIPLTFDDMPDKVKNESPWLKDYCLYNLQYNSGNSHYLLGHKSYKCNEHLVESEREGMKPTEFNEQPINPISFEGESETKQTSDEKIEPNNSFRYPLVRKCPSSDEPQRCERVVIVLHGLNEFSFLKYMPWAYGILMGANAPTSVILFPLTFSIKRADRQWADLEFKRKIMAAREKLPGNQNANRFNSIISGRMEAHPERFFWGAMQSYWDIVDLARQIRNKDPEQQHPHIAPDARIDFLGFSSGGYLALTLLAVNHERLFEDSRASLFATCVEMRSLGSSTPYTVDRSAENKMRERYVDGFDALPDARMKHYLELHPEGRWMSSFGGQTPARTQREARVAELGRRLLGIANTNDQVMKFGAMRDVLQGVETDTGVTIERLALGIHEHPFCLSDYARNLRGLVAAFDPRYSKELEQFIDLNVKHFNRTYEH